MTEPRHQFMGLPVICCHANTDRTPHCKTDCIHAVEHIFGNRCMVVCKHNHYCDEHCLIQIVIVSYEQPL